MIYDALKLTSSEKAYILRHPKFKTLWEARLLDVFFEVTKLKREAWECFKFVGKCVGAVTVQNNGSGNKVILPANSDAKITITAKPSKEVIEATPVEDDGAQEEG